MRIAIHLKGGSVIEADVDDWGITHNGGQATAWRVTHLKPDQTKDRVGFIDPSQIAAVVRLK